MGRTKIPLPVGPRGILICRRCPRALRRSDLIRNGVTKKRGPRTWMEGFCRRCRAAYINASKRPGAPFLERGE